MINVNKKYLVGFILVYFAFSIVHIYYLSNLSPETIHYDLFHVPSIVVTNRLNVTSIIMLMIWLLPNMLVWIYGNYLFHRYYSTCVIFFVTRGKKIETILNQIELVILAITVFVSVLKFLLGIMMVQNFALSAYAILYLLLYIVLSFGIINLAILGYLVTKSSKALAIMILLVMAVVVVSTYYPENIFVLLMKMNALELLMANLVCIIINMLIIWGSRIRLKTIDY